MRKKLLKILLPSFCFFYAIDAVALLTMPPEYVLQIPQRPTSFPLQRPTRVCDVVSWAYGNDMVPPANLENVVQVSAGWDFTVALKGDGTVVQWGLSGQNPVPSDLDNVVQVAAGYDYKLALKSDGTVVSWGRSIQMPTGLSNVVQIAAGDGINLALKSDGSVFFWGDNTSGFTQPEGLVDVVQVVAGIDSAIALKSDGTVVAWGHSWDGITTPNTLSNVVQVAAGEHHSIALKGNGRVLVWGSYFDEPPLVQGFVQISAFWHNALGLKSDGTVVAWGYASGNFSDIPPVPSNLKNVVLVSAGGTHSVALVHKQGSMIPVQGGISANGMAVADFEIGKYEVTWGEWQEVRNWAVGQGYSDLASVGNGTGANHPVRDVNWHDVVKWCNAKSEKEGLAPVYSVNGTVYRSGESGSNLVQKNDAARGYRLPSQAEWQWAAGGGVSSSGLTYSGSNDISTVGWFAGNTNGTTNIVGSKAANELGIYDMSGNVMEWCEGLHLGAYRLLHGGSFTKTADWCTVSFGGLTIYDARAWDFGFRLARKGAASPDPSPTPSPTPSPAPPDFSRLAGTYIGNYRTTDLETPADTLLRNGQVLITVQKKRTFSGSVLLNGRKAGFRGKFHVNGNWSGQVTLAGHMVEIEMLLEGGELGNRMTGTLGIDGINKEGASSFVCLPVSNTGLKGDEFALTGLQINMVMVSEGISGKSFGHGYAIGKCGKDGAIRFTGRLADNTPWSGASRVVRDEVESLCLPVAVALTRVRGLLMGEAMIDPAPDEGELHLQSSEAWRWARSANSKSQTFAEGFVEELGVLGQVWNWPKGTSALGGSSANFTLTLSAPSGFEIAPGAESLSGSLGASNKPTWTSALPKDFTMKITPTSGLVSGNLPGTLNGKAVVLSYQGLIFPSDMELDSGAPVRGAGFISGSTGSGAMEMLVP
jgi:hypothetical protein